MIENFLIEFFGPELGLAVEVLFLILIFGIVIGFLWILFSAIAKLTIDN